MALPYVTGPVHVWAIVPPTFLQQLQAAAIQAVATALGTPTAGAAVALTKLQKQAVYLGTSERAPREAIRRFYAPIHNDSAGPIVPFDKLYAGQEGWAFMDLTRWNENVYQALACAPRPGGFPGADLNGDIGTAMMTEGAGFPLILRYPYYDIQAKPYKAAGMQAGIRFLCAFLEGEDQHEGGTDANKRHLAFYAQRVYNPQTGALQLYDFQAAGIPANPGN